MAEIKEQNRPSIKKPTFNYNVPSSRKFVVGENVKQALAYLQGKTYDDIYKARETTERTPERDDIFTSLYLANEALGQDSKLRHKWADELFEKFKINPHLEKNADFLGTKLRHHFEERFREEKAKNITNSGVSSAAQKANQSYNPNIEKEASNFSKETKAPFSSKEEPASSKTTSSGVEYEKPQEAPTTAASQATIGTPQQPSQQPQQQPVQEQPQQPAQSNIDLTKPVDPQTAITRIKELKASTGKEIDDIINKLETSNDLTAKMGLSKVLAVKKSFERKMTRYEREANAGPHSARKALNYAETDAQIAKHTAFKHTLKGTFRRGVGRMAETGQSMKNRVQKAGQNIKNKVETSETLKKVYGNIKPEMERAKERTTRGMEKVGQAYQKIDTEGRDLVKQYLPNELNRYLKGGDITRAILRRRAKAQRNKAMTPQPVPQNNQPVPQLAYNKQGQKMLPKLEGLDISRKVLMHYTRNRI